MPRVSCLPLSDKHRIIIIMKNQSLLSAVYASLVLSACFIQGYSLPQHRYSADEFGRKFGGASNDISNSIDGELATKLSAEAKEEGSLITTVVELALKFAPTLINLISGETGPSQTDRVDGIDLNVRKLYFKIDILFTNCLTGRGSLLLEEHGSGRPQAVPRHRRGLQRR